jgi:anti-sigma B factor antagonist
MKLESVEHGDAIVVSIHSETLDITNRHEFSEGIVQLVEDYSKVVLDLGELRFLDSSGLGALLILRRKRHESGRRGEIKLCGMHSAVRTLFGIVKMDKVFEIVDTPEDALSSF